jgi:hypothetical protein
MSLQDMQDINTQQRQQIQDQERANAEMAIANLQATAGSDAKSAALIEDQARTQGMFDRQNLRKQDRMMQANLQTGEGRLQDRILGQLPQADLAIAGLGQQDIMNRLRQKRMLEDLDVARYQAEMGNFAQSQTAEAIRGSKSKGLLGNLFGGLF